MFPVPEQAGRDSGIFLERRTHLTDPRERSWTRESRRKAADDEAIPLIWARNSIRDLESDFGRPRGSRQKRSRRDSLTKLIDISMEYGVLSSETSFVGVEDREEEQRSDRPAELRRVPVAITTGWHGIDRMQGLALAGAPSKRDLLNVKYQMVTSPAEKKSRFKTSLHCTADISSLLDSVGSAVLGKAPDMTAGSSEAGRERDDIDHLLEILGEQNADGSFPLTDIVTDYCGDELKTLVQTAESLEKRDREMARSLLATLWVLKTIITRVPASKDLWRPAAGKALEWLNSQESTPDWTDLKGLTEEMVDCWRFINQ